MLLPKINKWRKEGRQKRKGNKKMKVVAEGILKISLAVFKMGTLAM